MSDTEETFPCHITDCTHGPHPWTPIVVDPDNPQVLHVFRDAPVICPGVPAEVPDAD